MRAPAANTSHPLVAKCYGADQCFSIARGWARAPLISAPWPRRAAKSRAAEGRTAPTVRKNKTTVRWVSLGDVDN